MKFKSCENSCTETHDVLTSVYVNGARSHTEVFKWFQRFQEGYENRKGWSKEWVAMNCSKYRNNCKHL